LAAAFITLEEAPFDLPFAKLGYSQRKRMCSVYISSGSAVPLSLRYNLWSDMGSTMAA
jgi:hypothetical protein